MSEKLGCQNEVVCNLVKSSLSQARKSYQTYVEMSSRMLPAGSSNQDFRLKALEFAKQDADANFEFALRLLDARTLDEVIGMQDEHASRQTGEMARRVAELQALGGSAAAEETSAGVHGDEGSVGSAAAAAALAGVTAAAASTPLQTAELDSTAIAAELEQQIGGAVAEGDMSAEIEALAARIHEAKSVNAPAREISDDAIAEAVAAAELEDLPAASNDDAEVQSAAAEFEHALVADDSELDTTEEETVADDSDASDVEEAAAEFEELLATGQDEAEADSDEVGVGNEDIADVEDAAAEFEHMLVADDEEIEVQEAAAELEHALEITDEEILTEEVAEVVAAASPAPATEQAVVPAKTFSLDLAAQLDAVRALIRGGAVASDAPKAPAKTES